MANLEPARSGMTTSTRPATVVAAAAAAALVLVGAWLLAGTGRRSASDDALLSWVEPMRVQASVVERDVAETDRFLRVFLYGGRPGDAESFDRKRAELGAELARFRALAGSAGREAREAGVAFASAVDEKYLKLADDIYAAAKAEPQEGGRLGVIARLGPKDPLEDLRNERDALAAALDAAHVEHLRSGAAIATSRPMWLALGFGFVLVGAIAALWLATQGGRRAAPSGGLDLGLIRAVLDQLPDGIGIFDGNGRAIVSNLAAARSIHAADDGPSRLTLFDADGTPLGGDQSPLARALAGQHVHERDVFAARLDGSLAPVDVNAEPILDHGHATAAVVVIRDISDEQRVGAEIRAVAERAESAEANSAEIARRMHDLETELERALAASDELRGETEQARRKAEARSERFARIVAGGGPVGVAVFDAKELRLLDSNVAGLALLGERRRARDVRGSTLVEIVPGAAGTGLVDLFQKVVASGEPYSSEEYYVQGLRHGVSYWRFSLVPVANEAGAPADELVLLGVDVTGAVEQRAASAVREAKGQWSVVDILLAISNDLRTPILSIQGMVDLFRQKYAEAVPDVTALHYLELTQRNADQIAALIDEIVDLSNIGQSDLTASEIPLAAAIEEAWRASPRHGIELRIAGPLPTVRADRALLMRGVRDLFDTAARLKRSGDGAWMHVRVRETDDHWEIELTDNGKGVADAAEGERLFGPLARRAASASTNGGLTLVGGGMGLAALRRIAELHGGEASVAPGEPEGAVYRFTLAK
jgi:signal transduction histidine kinase